MEECFEKKDSNKDMNKILRYRKQVLQGRQ
jgi:hypothetical protein